jgi:subtilase family protein
LLTRIRAAALAGMAAITMLAATTLTAVGPAASASTLPSPAAGKLVHELLSAWQITKGEGVTVAVLSTGVDPVTGLAGKVTKGPDYVPVAGTPNDDGTLMASLIAGSGPSSADPLGTVGRAPGARILSLKVVDWGAGRAAGRYLNNKGWDNLEAMAIRYAVNHGAQVIVIDEFVGFSPGAQDQDPLDGAVAYAMSKNVVVVGSDGVASGDTDILPDDLPGVINFSTTTLKGMLPPTAATPNAHNYSILVTAPDNTVFATCPSSSLCWTGGAFAAEAWVAGTIALIKAVYPHISPALVARALALSASYHPAGGYNTKVGFGLINPSGALQEAGKLASLTNAAKPGAGVVSTTAHFGSGPAPGIITAVQHSPVKLAGYAAGVVIGLILLLFALLLGRRWRRAGPPFATPPPPADSPPPAAPALP